MSTEGTKGDGEGERSMTRRSPAGFAPRILRAGVRYRASVRGHEHGGQVVLDRSPNHPGAPVRSIVSFTTCFLGRADLRGADLSHAVLVRADLSAADLSGTNFSEALMHEALLLYADLSNANLNGADLSGADLSDANKHKYDETSKKVPVTNEELHQQPTFLEGAIMPDGQEYEDWLKSKD